MSPGTAQRIDGGAPEPRWGFTLIELLITISIIALLSSMAMPMLGIAKRAAKRSNTQSILSTVEAGLGAFRTDIGVYPYHKHGTVDDTVEPNHLNDVIGWKRDAAAVLVQRTNLAADLQQVIDSNAASPLLITASFGRFGLIFSSQQANQRAGLDLMNRAINERGRLAILAGFKEVTGPVAGPIAAGPPQTPTFLTPQRIVPSPKSTGWQADYLGSDLPPSYRNGSSILDAYGNPLLYVCVHLPQPSVLHPQLNIEGIGEGGMWQQDASISGLGLYSEIHPAEYELGAITRTITSVLASDVRTHAAKPYIATYELWSAGPDGSSQPTRSDLRNADDIPAGPYRSGLQ